MALMLELALRHAVLPPGLLLGAIERVPARQRAQEWIIVRTRVRNLPARVCLTRMPLHFTVYMACGLDCVWS